MKSKIKNNIALVTAVWSMAIMPTMPSYAKMLPHNNHVTHESNMNNISSENERWFAEHAKEAATILSENKNSQQLSETAQNYALNAASGAATSKIEKWLSHYGNVKARVGIDKDLSLDSSELDWLIPWYDNDKTVLFTQHSLHRTDSRWQTNNGIGVRQFTDGAMYGVNAFYDYDISQSHTRVGLGAEYWMNYLRLSANGYYRLSSWRTADGLNNDYNARPANGWDVNAEGWLPSYPNIGANLKLEQYYGDEVALFGKDKRQQNPLATTVGLNWTPFPLLTLGAEHKMGSAGMSDTQAKIDFTWQFGQNLTQQLDPSQVAALRQFNGNRYDFVNRNNNIVLEYQKKSLISLVLNQIVRGSTGQELSVISQVNSKYPLDKIIWQAPELTLAGGVVNHSGNALTIKLPSHKTASTAQEQLKANRYRLTAIAYDNQGNASSQAETWIEVTDAGIVTIPSSSVVKISSGIANSTDINTLKVIIKDAFDHAVPNTKVTFTLPTGLKLVDANKKMSSQNAAYNSVMKKAQATKSTDEQKYTATTNEHGEASVQFTASSAGKFNITATPEYGQPIVSEFDFKADTTQSEIKSIKTLETSVVADGIATHRIQVHVTDTNGNDAKDALVNFDATNAIIEKTKKTNKQGIAEVTVSSTKVGKSTVTATINGKKQTLDIEFVAGDVAKIIIDKTLTTSAGVDGNLQIKLTDNNGHPVVGMKEQITVSIDGKTVPLTLVESDIGDYIGELAGRQTGTYTITVSMKKDDKVASQLTWTVRAPKVIEVNAVDGSGKTGERGVVNSVQLDTLNTSPLISGDKLNLKVTLKDAYGNKLKGLQTSNIKLTHNQDRDELIQWLDNNDGTYTAKLTLTYVSNDNLTVSVNNKVSPKQQIMVNSAKSVKYIASVTLNRLAPSKENNSHPITVILQDYNSQPVSDVGENIVVKINGVIENINFKESNIHAGSYTGQISAKKSGNYDVEVIVNHRSSGIETWIVQK